MQKIMVCIKRVVDYNVRIRVKPDGSGVMLDGVKMSVNPFDEIALEEALRIKERVGNVEVVAVSIGISDTQQQLRTALAMGAALWLATRFAPVFTPGAHGLVQAIVLFILIVGGIAIYGLFLRLFGITGWREAVNAIRQNQPRDLRD